MNRSLSTRRGFARRTGHCQPEEEPKPRSTATISGPALAVRPKSTAANLVQDVRKPVFLLFSLFFVTAPWFHFQIKISYNYQPSNRRRGVFPRVVQYEMSRLQILPIIRVPRKSTRKLQYPLSQIEPMDRLEDDWGRSDTFESGDCKAQQAWQLATYPSCNVLHEVGLATLSNLKTSFGDKQILANGYWRDVWRIQEASPESIHDNYNFVLKTQRYQHDFVERNFDRNRRDALVSEHFTSSPYISDLFGFCGNSCLSEYADGGDMTHAIWSYNLTKSEELVLATQAAVGLAALHNTDKEGRATVAHTDINPGQFIKVGKAFKLSDFNRARLLRWNARKDQPCGYKVERNPGRNRSPEEYKYQMQSEKVDVYSLGNIFYMILQKEWPFSEVEEKEAKRLVKEGYRPSFDADVWNSTHPVDQALKEAMIMCHEQDPEHRATSRHVEAYLRSRLAALYPNITFAVAEGRAWRRNKTRV